MAYLDQDPFQSASSLEGKLPTDLAYELHLETPSQTSQTSFPNRVIYTPQQTSRSLVKYAYNAFKWGVAVPIATLFTAYTLHKGLDLYKSKYALPESPAPRWIMQVAPKNAHRLPFLLDNAQCNYLEALTGIKYDVPHGCLTRTYKQGSVEINEGIWGAPIPHEKAETECWGAFFGGSSVEGYMDGGAPNSFPNRVQTLANEKHLCDKVKTWTYARAGGSTVDQRWHFENRSLMVPFDFNVFYMSENDTPMCNFFSNEGGEKSTESRLRAYLFSGDAAILKQLHPWFAQHSEDWRRVSEKKHKLVRNTYDHLLSLNITVTPPESEENVELARMLQSLRTPEEALMDENWFETLWVESRRRITQVSGSPALGGMVKPDLEGIATSFMGTVPAGLLRAEDRFTKNMHYMVKTSLERGALPILMQPPLDVYGHELSTPTCQNYPLEAEDLAAYMLRTLHDEIGRLGTDLKVPVIDVHNMLTQGVPPGTFFVDQVHLNDAGLDKVANSIIPYLPKRHSADSNK